MYAPLKRAERDSDADTAKRDVLPRKNRKDASHYVYASDDGFDPNFSTQKADTTRMMVPFFRQFWDMGAKDKATGKSRSDVQQRIQQFHSQEFLNSLRGTTQFAGTDYRSKDLTPKKSRLLADTISAVYLDGYEGRQ
ncbi:Exc2 family lipoprotein [Escherichia coli]|nr:Exc2 family lipoprotein [Escherichia coli]